MQIWWWRGQNYRNEFHRGSARASGPAGSGQMTRDAAYSDAGGAFPRVFCRVRSETRRRRAPRVRCVALEILVIFFFSIYVHPGNILCCLRRRTAEGLFGRVGMQCRTHCSVIYITTTRSARGPFWGVFHSAGIIILLNIMVYSFLTPVVRAAASERRITWFLHKGCCARNHVLDGVPLYLRSRLLSVPR